MYGLSMMISKARALSMTEKRRPWSDLPSEILSQISDRLGLVDLLRFRSVCKPWKLASSVSTAESESSPDRSPSLLVYGEGSRCRWTGLAGDNFSVEVPELDGGATCLASKHGWLLVLQNQGAIFFLCPFSRARIDLPRLELDEPERDRPVAAFSSAPSSRDCAVVIALRKSPNLLVLNLIRRGEENWTALEYDTLLPKAVSCGAYRGGAFYFFDCGDGMLKFSLEDLDLKPYRIVSPTGKDTTKERVPFILRRNHLTDQAQAARKWLEIPQDASISTCGTYVESNHIDSIVFNENLDAAAQNQEESAAAAATARRLKGVWIHPRFFQISTDEFTW